MRKDKQLTLNEHKEVADDLAIAFHHLTKAFNKCQEHYPKSHSLIETFFRVHPGNMNSTFCTLKSQLDDEYHKLITDTEFQENGHIYYNLEERYKKLNGLK